MTEDEAEEYGINNAIRFPEDWKHIGYTTDSGMGKGKVFFGTPAGEEDEMWSHDPVKHPSHYTDRVPGIECIQVSQHFNFNLGNAIKYIWRSGTKNPDPREDLRKAIQYLEFELGRIGNDDEDDGEKEDEPATVAAPKIDYRRQRLDQTIF